jgi:very-short-patch-repair endonuclease
MTRLFHDYGLPAPKVEVKWGPKNKYRLDFAYPRLRLAIEVNGWVYHSSPEHARRDAARRNRLQRAGWIVLNYDWWEVTNHPGRVAAEIAATYRSLAAA